MHFIINALSVTNTSGRHVLMGHLRQLTRAHADQHFYTVLHHVKNREMVEDLEGHVNWHECPPSTIHWLRRSLWERYHLPSLVAQLKGNVLFAPNGIAATGLKIPQVIFCQNPWCLVPGIHQSLPQKGKGWVQRYAYRQAVQKAEVMVFNSQYMREAYTQNAGKPPRQNVIAYQGIDEQTFAAAQSLSSSIMRNNNQVLTVSAMGSHKGLETVCEAFQLLRYRYHTPATWKIIGAWPDQAYEDKIKKLVVHYHLEDQVEFAGHVSMNELHQAYASSRVFCLMSRCESFGIPAVEAQCFGTPVVTSNCCALPEIDGDGGIFPEAGNAEQTAQALHQLLTDDAAWQALSEKAHRNAERFHWATCSKPLVDCFNRLAKSAIEALHPHAPSR